MNELFSHDRRLRGESSVSVKPEQRNLTRAPLFEFPKVGL